MMNIAISQERDMPSKLGEFYPSTGKMADGRDTMWLMGELDTKLVIVRDLTLYSNDLAEIAGTDSVLQELVDQVREMRDRFIPKQGWYDREAGIYRYKKILCEEMSERLMALPLRTPMNPIEEAVGMMHRLWMWNSMSNYGDSPETARMAMSCIEEIDRINDAFWTRIDEIESGAYKEDKEREE